MQRIVEAVTILEGVIVGDLVVHVLAANPLDVSMERGYQVGTLRRCQRGDRHAGPAQQILRLLELLIGGAGGQAIEDTVGIIVFDFVVVCGVREQLGSRGRHRQVRVREHPAREVPGGRGSDAGCIAATTESDHESVRTMCWVGVGPEAFCAGEDTAIHANGRVPVHIQYLTESTDVCVRTDFILLHVSRPGHPMLRLEQGEIHFIQVKQPVKGIHLNEVYFSLFEARQ